MRIDKGKFNWYGILHDQINNKFEGELEYCGTFCIKGNYNPSAVYKSKNPNHSKGHKKYMLLTKYPYQKDLWAVSGMTPQAMKKERYQIGLWCPVCGDVIYSVNRHDYRECECQSCFIDGGKDYTRCNPEGVVVNIDLISGKVEFCNEEK